MNTDFDKQVTETKETSTNGFSWHEYSYYHDYFIELLSYDKKHNYTHNSIWEYSYV